MSQIEAKKVLGNPNRFLIYTIICSTFPILFFFYIITNPGGDVFSFFGFIFLSVMTFFLATPALINYGRYRQELKNTGLGQKITSGEIVPSFYFPPKYVLGPKFVIDDKSQRFHYGEESFPMGYLRRIEMCGHNSIHLFLSRGDQTVYIIHLHGDRKNQYTRLLNHLFNEGYWGN